MTNSSDQLVAEPAEAMPNPAVQKSRLEDIPEDFLDRPERWQEIKADLHQALLGDLPPPTLSSDFQKYLAHKYPRKNVVSELRSLHLEYAQRIKRTPQADIHLREVQLGHFIHLLSKRLIGLFRPDWHSIDRLLFEWKLATFTNKNLFELHELYKESIGLRKLSPGLIAKGLENTFKRQGKEFWTRWILGQKKDL